jgi:hypothetical protein
VNNDDIEILPFSEMRKRVEEKVKKRKIEPVFENENENKSSSSSSESSSDDSGENESDGPPQLIIID